MTLIRSPIHSPIRSPIYSPLVGKWGAFTDYSLFGPSDDGFLFNFSKTDRLFQDVAGTIPVAVDADPIALALDGHSWGGKTLAQVRDANPHEYFEYANTAALQAVWSVLSNVTTALDNGRLLVTNAN